MGTINFLRATLATCLFWLVNLLRRCLPARLIRLWYHIWLVDWLFGLLVWFCHFNRNVLCRRRG